MKPTWTRIKAIVDLALDLDPGEREAFLQDACGGDHELREVVELVISGESAASSFLEPPIEGAAQQIVDKIPNRPAGKASKEPNSNGRN